MELCLAICGYPLSLAGLGFIAGLLNKPKIALTAALAPGTLYLGALCWEMHKMKKEQREAIAFFGPIAVTAFHSWWTGIGFGAGTLIFMYRKVRKL